MKPIKTNSVEIYLKMKNQRKAVHWKYFRNELKFFFNGKWHKENQINIYYPVYEYVMPKPCN